jgi:4-amino-4-deoxy-L-arabinose transferase-like glycosyltransferase
MKVTERKQSLATAGLLVFLTLLAFGLRVAGLGAQGLAEDEANKMAAVAAYRAGDFTSNAEHPMLMKSAMTTCVVAAEWLERHAPSVAPTPEAALRFPNAVFGALTTLVLAWLATLLFSSRVGLIAAGIWTTNILAISINRIGKEDTFLVFFMLLSYAAYFQAKRISLRRDPADRSLLNRLYLLSGSAMGLMIASKYFPHYWGLLFLWEWLSQRFLSEKKLDNPIPKSGLWRFYLGMGGAFLLANPVVVLPSTLAYMKNYTEQGTVTHHGYLLMDRLFYNDPSHSAFAGGLPVFFYGLLLFVKTNPLALGAMIAGLLVTLRRWREPHSFFLLFMTLFWVVPFSIIGAKWMRYTLSLTPYLCIFAAIGIENLVWLGTRLARGSDAEEPARRGRFIFAAAGLVVCVCALDVVRTVGHPALYMSPLVGGQMVAGRYFPHDEFYDAGLREAFAKVAVTAPSGATVATETPMVANYYLKRFNRTDLSVEVLSDANFSFDATAGTYCVVQTGRTYFENRARLAFIANAAESRTPVLVADKVAAQVLVISAETARAVNELPSGGSVVRLR